MKGISSSINKENSIMPNPALSTGKTIIEQNQELMVVEKDTRQEKQAEIPSEINEMRKTSEPAEKRQREEEQNAFLESILQEKEEEERRNKKMKLTEDKKEEMARFTPQEPSSYTFQVQDLSCFFFYCLILLFF